jgi:hypothetical protein
MSRGPWAIKPKELIRAIKALRDAGLEVAQVKQEKEGGFTLIVGKPGESNGGDTMKNEANEWDEVLNGTDRIATRQ